jgi:hypothetical protein
MLSVMLLGLSLIANLTNLEMVEVTVSQALLPVAEEISHMGLESLTLVIQGEHEGGWLLEQSAIRVLGEAGVTVSTMREGDGWQLRLRPMQMGVTYSQTRRSWVFGGKQVPRHASCLISATLVDPDGNVALSLRENAYLESTVPASDILVLKSATERWANGEISSEESGNILEPLVVTGVVTALVYLFYSSRN